MCVHLAHHMLHVTRHTSHVTGYPGAAPLYPGTAPYGYPRKHYPLRILAHTPAARYSAHAHTPAARYSARCALVVLLLALSPSHTHALPLQHSHFAYYFHTYHTVTSNSTSPPPSPPFPSLGTHHCPCTCINPRCFSRHGPPPGVRRAGETRPLFSCISLLLATPITHLLPRQFYC